MRSMGGTPTARCTSEQLLLHAKLQERVYTSHGGLGPLVYVDYSPKHATVRRASSVTQCAILREPFRHWQYRGKY